MAEANGHDIPRGQIRERGADDSVTPGYKRQKSERTILAGQLGGFHLQGNGTEEEGIENGNHESVTSPVDETDGAGRAVQGFLEDSLNTLTRGRLSHQIGFERDNVTDEQYENNIFIRHPERHIDDKIRLGVHFRKHKHGGFIVRKVLEDGLIANKDIRAEDIVTHVQETDVRQMSLADLQNLFWNLTFEAKITLKILRVFESEDETDGASVSYEELTVNLKVTADDDSVEVTTEIVVRSARYVWGSFPEESFYISVFVHGNPRYLCAQQDMTLKAAILTQADRHNPNYLWRQQWCNNLHDTPYRLLYNVGTGMTVSCCNITSGQRPFIVKMSPKQTFERGILLESTEHDRVFKGLHVTEGKDNYYLESVLDPAYYMCLSSDPGYENCLEMATEGSHPKTEFHFDFQTERK